MLENKQLQKASTKKNYKRVATQKPHLKKQLQKPLQKETKKQLGKNNYTKIKKQL